MLIGAPRLSELMGDLPGTEPDVPALTAYFAYLFLLMATQDIAVDGWALTMLSEERVAWASTCNSVGQTLGYFVAYVGFLALNDETTCNLYLRKVPGSGGLVTLPGFVTFWGWVFVATTAAVAVLKKERREADAPSGILQMYRDAVACCSLPPVREYALVLLTAKVGFAAVDSATSLKLTEHGMPKEELALLSPFLAAAGIIVPLVISRHTTGPEPLRLYLRGVPLRLGLNALYGLLVPLAASVYGPEPSVGVRTYYGLVTAAAFLNVFAVNLMFVAQMSFANRVADPAIGGTYITLINTLANLGGTWAQSLALYVLDFLTDRACVHKRTLQPIPTPQGHEALCAVPADAACARLGGSCHLVRDGYTVELVACTALGLAWLAVFRGPVLRLQGLD
eukprot:CAMPEP_0206004066 /NCGR_PEP_ID=MMETSP1464-20131121/3757_1 /ASSEMBLY_ACC=CAM_ASM_001124 /TAXON_ID=119497 /ORGANISM="Exanthemachrysis gayraliae, Strain RCC1523" /LENGTH=394 /DNA_ID=CAMNT_0053377465 /DNA_START=21 /DNA_END=1202 /DNA_ORIENTATION=-